MTYLKKQEVDGYIELVDTRTDTVVARVPVDRTKMTSTFDRYEAVVRARNERLEHQKHEDAKLFARIWNEPMSF